MPATQQAEVGGPQEDDHLIGNAWGIQGVVNPESCEAHLGGGHFLEGSRGSVVPEQAFSKINRGDRVRVNLMDPDGSRIEKSRMEELDLKSTVSSPEGGVRTKTDRAILIVVHREESGRNLGAWRAPGHLCQRSCAFRDLLEEVGRLGQGRRDPPLVPGVSLDSRNVSPTAGFTPPDPEGENQQESLNEEAGVAGRHSGSGLRETGKGRRALQPTPQLGQSTLRA